MLLNIYHKCMIRISENLNLKGCEKITDTSIFRVAEGCLKLLSQDLGFCNNINDLGVIKIAESCLESQFLGLECLVKISDTSILQISKLSKNIRRTHSEKHR
jgi:F-box and leucine-rich repeat protein 1 (S-phase kinase-associated protein 2)